MQRFILTLCLVVLSLPCYGQANLGTKPAGSTFARTITTKDPATGNPAAWVDSPGIAVRKAGLTAEETDGVDLTTGHGTFNGNLIEIDTSEDEAYYVNGDYEVVVTGGTVANIEQDGEVIAVFTIADALATAEEVNDVLEGARDTRDLDDVQHVWTLRRTGSNALQSTTEATLKVYPGNTDVRVGWDCNIPSILPNGTVLATMTDPVSENADLTLTKLGIGPNGLKQPMLAKVRVDVAADATPGDYWITTQVTNRLGGGPITIYGKVTVLEVPE